MSQPLLYALTAAALLGIGLYGLLTRPHLLRRLIAVNIIGTAVFLLLISLAGRDPDGVDPVPQAMVLTGIVVAVSMTGFALILARRLFRGSGRFVLGEDRGR